VTCGATSCPVELKIDTVGRPESVQVPAPTFVSRIEPSTDPIAPPSETSARRSGAAHAVEGAELPESPGIATPGPCSAPRLASPAEAPTTITAAPSTNTTAFRATRRRARATIAGGTS
jgi:hypothetical protein